MSVNNSERYQTLSQLREQKLERARLCAYLTHPSLLPPEGYGPNQQLPQPFSSVASRGVTGFASRLLSALMPLNDIPFFRFALKSGVDPSTEIENLLNATTMQVYRKLLGTNLREALFQTLQHLIVIGDTMLKVNDDFEFANTRLDHFVCCRSPEGKVVEVIYLEFIRKPDMEINKYALNSSEVETRDGFDTVYVRKVRSMEDEGVWEVTKQLKNGELIEDGSGTVTVPYCAVLGWMHIAGEDYSRSHCEENIGDITALDSYTEMNQQGLAAASAFWMGVDPAGTADIEDIQYRPVGSWVGMRPNEVFSVSPDLRPQVDASNAAVETMRREVGQIFLTTASAIPSGDRVTATAIRMIGAELETITGGAFSAIAREAFSFIIKRVVLLMLENGELDPRLHDQFFSDEGELSVEVVTGLQALTRDTELTKLLQLGEVIRNLPEDAAARFRWGEYTSAIVSAIGFDAEEWIKSDEEVQQEMQAAQAQQMAMEAERNIASSAGQAIAQEAAPQLAGPVADQLMGGAQVPQEQPLGV